MYIRLKRLSQNFIYEDKKCYLPSSSSRLVRVSKDKALVVVEFSVIFEGPGSAMWVIIEVVGTAVVTLGTVAEASELVVEVL